MVARLADLPKQEIESRLQVIGALIGFSRQLDIQLRSDQDVDQFVEQFFNRYANLAKSLPGGGENEQIKDYGLG